jgi:heme A synthase
MEKTILCYKETLLPTTLENDSKGKNRMEKKLLLVFLILVASTFAWKKEVHFISLPFIEGTGLYSSIMILEDSKTASTKVPAVATVSLLVANAALGATAVFGPQDLYPTFRTIHRYVGFGITAAGLWMSIAAANDRNVKNLERNVSYAFTALSTVPIIIFSF